MTSFRRRRSSSTPTPTGPGDSRDPRRVSPRGRTTKPLTHHWCDTPVGTGPATVPGVGVLSDEGSSGTPAPLRPRVHDPPPHTGRGFSGPSQTLSEDPSLPPRWAISPPRLTPARRRPCRLPQVRVSSPSCQESPGVCVCPRPRNPPDSPVGPTIDPGGTPEHSGVPRTDHTTCSCGPLVRGSSLFPVCPENPRPWSVSLTPRSLPGRTLLPSRCLSRPLPLSGSHPRPS